MQTLKQVLNREDERRNLKNVVLCLLTTLVMVIFAFGLIQVDFFPRGMEDNGSSITEVYGER